MNALLNTAAVVGHNQPAAAPKLTDSQMKAIAQTMDKLADKLAAKVTPEMEGTIVKVVQAKKDWQGGPLVLLSLIKAQFDDETVVSFPTPGSEVGDCPDKYKVAYYRDGRLKFKATTFYAEMFKRTPAGKAIEVQLAFIALAKDEKANHTTVPPAILSLNPVDLERLKGTLEQERNVAVAAWRSAMGLQKQFDAINALDKVEAMPLMDKEGNIYQAAKPIKVWNTEKPDLEYNLYSVGAFLMFDAAKASEHGGTFEALKLTVKRDQGESGPAGSETAPHIATNKTLAAFLLTTHEFIANKHLADKKRELYSLFLKDQINGAGSDQLVQAIRDLEMWAKAILDIPAVQSRLENIDQRAAA